MFTASKFLVALLLSFLPITVHATGGEVDHGEPCEELTEKHHGGRAPASA